MILLGSTRVCFEPWYQNVGPGSVSKPDNRPWYPSGVFELLLLLALVPFRGIQIAAAVSPGTLPGRSKSEQIGTAFSPGSTPGCFN